LKEDQSTKDKPTVADVIVDTLDAFGVDYAFGIPGTQVNRILDGLRKKKHPKFVLVRDEGAGAIMATVVGRLTGKLGACVGMAAPGAAKMINGLLNAKVDHTPVLAITGQVETFRLGSEYDQEIDIPSLFSSICVYNHLLVSPESAGYLVSSACRQAIERRGVAHLCVPEDIQSAHVIPRMNTRDPRVVARGELVLDEMKLGEAAGLLNAARSVVIIAGRGASGCGTLLSSISEKLHAPVYTTFPGRDSIRSDHPNNLGIMWIFSSRSKEVIQKADAVLLLGTDLPYMQQILPREASLIQIDTDPRNIGKRVGVDVAVISPVSDALTRLVRLVNGGKKDDRYISLARSRMSGMFDLLEEKRRDRSKPINPYRLVKAIEETAEEDAIFTTDAGAVELYFGGGFKFKNHKFVVHGRYSSLGFGIPAAIAAQLVFPRRQIIAIEGDFGFETCLSELVTAAENNLPIKVIVFNNRRQVAIELEQITQGLQDYANKLNDFNFAKFAEACGIHGARVEDPRELVRSLDDFFSEKGPAVLDVVISSEQPPIF
jgi:pyruvate oxidase